MVVARASIGDRHVPKHRQDVQPERPLDHVSSRVPVKLMWSPLSCVLRDRDLPGARVDVLPAGDVCVHAHVVPFSVGLALKQLCPSLARVRVAPSDAPSLAPAMSFRRATLAGLWVAPGEIPKIIYGNQAACSSRPSIQRSTSAGR